jgi:hypothetical protein
MRRRLFSVVSAVLLLAPYPTASAVLLATVVRPPTFTPRICVYTEGGKVRSCPVTGVGPQYAIGRPCYCGNSPKGIIRAAPMTLAPN